MKNKHIELVKRWVAGEAVSVEVLKANAEAAYFAAAYAADAAYAAANVAFEAANIAYVTQQAIYSPSGAANADAAYVEADHWVKRYEELTNEK